MKIIILTHYSYKTPPTSLDICQTRFHVYAYLIYKYLSKKDDLEVEFDMLPQKGKSIVNNHNLENYKIKIGDHAIIVDDKGLHSRSKKFKDKLKEHIKGFIISVGLTSVYYGGEDMLFYFDKTSKIRKNTKCIGWLCDERELIPNKTVGIIRILIQKPENNLHGSMKCYLDMLEKINKFVEANADNIDMDIGILGNNFYENLLTGEIEHLDNFEKKYDVMQKCDIYFATTNVFDREVLFNLGMCNALIVSKKLYIDPTLHNYFDIVFIKKVVPWRDIIERLNSIKSRKRLIDDKLCACHSIDLIYDYLKSYDIKNYRNLEIIREENRLKNSKYYKAKKKYAEAKGLTMDEIKPTDSTKKKKFLMITSSEIKKKNNNNKKEIKKRKNLPIVQSGLRFIT